MAEQPTESKTNEEQSTNRIQLSWDAVDALFIKQVYALGQNLFDWIKRHAAQLIVSAILFGSLIWWVTYAIRFESSGDALLAGVSQFVLLVLGGGISVGFIVRWFRNPSRTDDSNQTWFNTLGAGARIVVFLILIVTLGWRYFVNHRVTNYVDNLYHIVDQQDFNKVSLAKTLAALTSAAEFQPEYALTHYLLGALHITHFQDTETAQHHFQNAIWYAKGDTDEDEITLLAQIDLAHLYIRTGQYDRAVPLLRQARTLSAVHSGQWPRWEHGRLTDLGWALMEMGQLKEAERFLDEAITLGVQDTAAPSDTHAIRYASPPYCLQALTLEKQAESLSMLILEAAETGTDPTDWQTKKGEFEVEAADMWFCCWYHYEEDAPNDYRWREQSQRSREVAGRTVAQKSYREQVELCGEER